MNTTVSMTTNHVLILFVALSLGLPLLGCGPAEEADTGEISDPAYDVSKQETDVAKQKAKEKRRAEYDKALKEADELIEQKMKEAQAEADAAVEAWSIALIDFDRSVADVRANGVTIAEFNRISTRMTYDEVVAIAGEPSERLSETYDGRRKELELRWNGLVSGTNITISFVNGKVIAKAQFGLRGVKEHINTVSLSQFNSIQTNMTYKQVVDIVGGPGELISETGLAWVKTHILFWNGDELGANMQVTFANGKVHMKAQYGLK